MNRRTIVIALATALVLALVTLTVNRANHPIIASGANTDSAAASSLPPSSAATPAPAANEAPEAPAIPSPTERRAADPLASPPPQAAATLEVDPHEALGSKSAPIIMEVFSDFQCPACKTLFVTTNRQLMDNYVSTGKVYLIHRDFPLPLHAHSRVAAQYSRAAAQIGKLEPVEEVLFQNQEKWEQNGDVDGTVASVLSASEIAKVRALVKSGSLDAAINKDQVLGQNYKVNQTPTTIIHHKGQTYPVVGIVAYDVLRQFLDQLLSQK